MNNTRNCKILKLYPNTKDLYEKIIIYLVVVIKTRINGDEQSKREDKKLSMI